MALLMIVSLVGWQIVKNRKKRQQITAAEQTAAMLGSLVSDLKAGASPHDAVVHVAMDAPADLVDTCQVAVHRSASGISPAVAFMEAPERFADLRAVGRLWQVAEARGIALAGLLEHMQQRIDTRLTQSRTSEAALQGPKATATILSLLPIVGIAMGSAMGAKPWSFLTHTGLGGMLLVGGVFLTCAGFVWVQRIIDKAGQRS